MTWYVIEIVRVVFSSLPRRSTFNVQRELADVLNTTLSFTTIFNDP